MNKRQRKKRHKTQLIEQTVSFLHSHMQGVFEVKVIFHRIKRHNPTELCSKSNSKADDKTEKSGRSLEHTSFGLS